MASVGPLDQAGILLSGHSDVVPVEGQQWDTPAFEAIQKDAKIFGRGTADIEEGFLACAMITMIKASQLELKKNLCICVFLMMKRSVVLGCVEFLINWHQR